MDGTLISTTTLGQSGYGINDMKGMTNHLK